MSKPENDLSPAERTVRDIVRDMVLDAVYVAERNGESLHKQLLKVIGDLHRSGTGLLILTKIGWPRHVSDVINELLEERRLLLLYEERCTELMKEDWEYDRARGVNLDEDSEITEFEGRYFVRPVRSEYEVGVNLDEE